MLHNTPKLKCNIIWSLNFTMLKEIKIRQLQLLIFLEGFSLELSWEGVLAFCFTSHRWCFPSSEGGQDCFQRS